MDVKFKIGDKVRRIKGSCSPGEGVIIKIKQDYSLNHILTVQKTTGNKKKVIWNGMFCEVIKDSASLCNCELDILMTVGCQCKGN